MRQERHRTLRGIRQRTGPSSPSNVAPPSTLPDSPHVEVLWPDFIVKEGSRQPFQERLANQHARADLEARQREAGIDDCIVELLRSHLGSKALPSSWMGAAGIDQLLPLRGAHRAPAGQDHSNDDPNRRR